MFAACLANIGCRSYIQGCNSAVLALDLSLIIYSKSLGCDPALTVSLTNIGTQLLSMINKIVVWSLNLLSIYFYNYMYVPCEVMVHKLVLFCQSFVI